MRQLVKVLGILGVIAALCGCYEPLAVDFPVKELSVKPDSRTLKLGESIEFYVSETSLNPRVTVSLSKIGYETWDFTPATTEIIKGNQIYVDARVEGCLNFDMTTTNSLAECHIKFTPETPGRYEIRFLIGYDQYINGDNFVFNVTE
jgi:hypothetical protein